MTCDAQQSSQLMQGAGPRQRSMKVMGVRTLLDPLLSRRLQAGDQHTIPQHGLHSQPFLC